MLMLARSKLERARLRNCVVRKGDMNHLPLPEASFDAVTIHQVLHYAERPARAIEEARSEEHTSELQSLMRSSYAVFCLKKKTHTKNDTHQVPTATLIRHD